MIVRVAEETKNAAVECQFMRSANSFGLGSGGKKEWIEFERERMK
jgi:hypothetical protein